MATEAEVECVLVKAWVGRDSATEGPFAASPSAPVLGAGLEVGDVMSNDSVKTVEIGQSARGTMVQTNNSSYAMRDVTKSQKKNGAEKRLHPMRE